MKTTLGFAAVALIALAAGAARRSPWIPDRGDGTYRNPVLHADYSDPDVVRVGDDYYMTASSFTCAPGLPLLHSKDLVNWQLIGHALPRQVPENVYAVPQHGSGCWAPAIRHHDGRFWIYYPDPDFGIYLVTARDPAGEWSRPVLVKGSRGAIDPCPLWDDDGQVYLVHAWARSRAGFANVLTLNRLSADASSVVDEGKVVVNGDAIPGYTTLEGPKFYKRDGYYWIFAPAGGVRTGWQSVFRSRQVDGPYEPRIVLEQGNTAVNGPHQGAWVETPTHEHWFLHFQDMGAYGRVVHLQPMTWREDGWPVIGNDPGRTGRGEPVRRWRKPDVGRSYPAATPAASDDFKDDRLGLQWQWQANPRDDWMSLRAKPGSLRLFSRPTQSVDNLWQVPQLLLQKWPAPEFVATAALTFSPVADGETAGLTVFGQDYAWLGLRSTTGGVRLLFRTLKDAHRGGSEAEKASLPFDNVGGAGRSRVYLRVAVTPGGICRFSFSRDNKSFSAIGDAFTGRQGIWVGAKVGIFAIAPQGASKTGHADWEWFRVE